MIKPNILLISIDTLRADHLSCYGYCKKTTPNIDSIASEGTIFRQNYSTGVWTPPGHASMVTGLYVSEHGVYGESRLSEDIPTIAEKLKENGYQTAGFVNNSQVGELVGLHRGHDIFVEVWKGVKPKSIVEKVIRSGIRRIKKKLGYEDMGANRTNKLFKNWIENYIDSKRPFYVFLHYIEPHNPLNPSRPYKNKYLDKINLKNVDIKKVNIVAHNPLICYVESINLNNNEIEVLKALYDAEIEYIDNKIGEIVEVLKGNNLYDNTMIIITSDHGEHFGEHALWSHAASLYNEVLHIPLIIKYPEGVEYIREVNEYTQLVDIFPTVQEIAGVPENKHKDNSGITLVYDSKNGNKFHDCVIAEWEGRVPYFIKTRVKDSKSSTIINRFTNKMWMILDERYKYISASDGKNELYDLENDRHELNNLVKQKREIATTMKIKLDRWKSSVNRKADEERSIMIDEVVKKNLEVLGYM